MKKQLRCLECGKKGNVMMCEKCGTVFCSIKCMAKNWEKPNSHHKICRKLAAMREKYALVVEDVLETLFARAREQAIGAENDDVDEMVPTKKRVQLNQSIEREVEQRRKIETALDTVDAIPNVNNVAVPSAFRSVLKRTDQQTMLGAFHQLLGSQRYAGMVVPFFSALTPLEEAVIFKDTMRMKKTIQVIVDLFATADTKTFAENYGPILIAFPNTTLPGNVTSTNTGIRLVGSFVIGMHPGREWKMIARVMARLDLRDATAILNDVPLPRRPDDDITGRERGVSLSAYKECVEILMHRGGCKRFAFRGVGRMSQTREFRGKSTPVEISAAEHVSIECDYATALIVNLFNTIATIEFVQTTGTNSITPKSLMFTRLYPKLWNAGLKAIDVMFDKPNGICWSLTISILLAIVENRVFWDNRVRDVVINAVQPVAQYDANLRIPVELGELLTTTKPIHPIRVRSLRIVISETVTLQVDANTSPNGLPDIAKIAMLLMTIK